ncbi:MAG TPA: MBL fold metallo-hydrolase [Smithella sp.]|nr:MBL fold metallo-hydrolase [Smithella sp.]HOG90215.1 MBL fold metallo-hydrolase [Smithella sp.]
MLKVQETGSITLFYMGRSPLGFLLYPVYAFLIGDTLIDTGTNRASREFLSVLKNRKITQIVNTHHHEDHIGNNAAIQEMFGIPVYAHPSALPCLDNPRLNNLRFYQRVVWDRPRPSKGQAIGSTVHAGIYHLEVIHAPGHTDDHICLYEPEQKWLFTGDLFCGTAFIYLRQDENYLQILDTLKKLSTLETDTLFCNLKGMVKNGREALLKKIARMEQLRDDVLHLKEKGLPPDEIRQKVLGQEGAMGFITRGHYSKQNTIDSILSGKRPDQIK